MTPPLPEEIFFCFPLGTEVSRREPSREPVNVMLKVIRVDLCQLELESRGAPGGNRDEQSG